MEKKVKLGFVGSRVRMDLIRRSFLPRSQRSQWRSMKTTNMITVQRWSGICMR